MNPRNVFVSPFDIAGSGERGIRNKLVAQVEAVRSLSGHCDWVSLSGAELLINDSRVCRVGTGLQARLLRWSCVWSALRTREFDFLYIRYALSDPCFVWFLYRIRRRYPRVTVLVEIPTFPYDGEYRFGLIKRILLLLDRLTRRLLPNFIDRIVTFSSHRSIWRVPTVRISNGIDFARIRPLSRAVGRATNDTVVLSSVSSVNFWHGIDRLIQGIAKYRRSEPPVNVVLNVIGDGAEIKKLKRLVSDLNVGGSVVFSGALFDSDLEKVMAATDIAVGSLAVHRKGMSEVRSLKNREYLARGLPVVFSEHDPDLPESLDFVYRAPPDESDINVGALVSWYCGLRVHSSTIVAYAQQFSWLQQMKLVLDAVNN